MRYLRAPREIDPIVIPSYGTYAFNIIVSDNCKRLLTQILRNYRVKITLHNGRALVCTYKGINMVERTPINILLLYDELAECEREIFLNQIREIEIL